MRFTKMHGLGNDFVFFEDMKGAARDYSTMAQNLCDRHTGIGADGIIIVLPSQTVDIRMRIFNADGSEAEMCGNGVRCFAKYVYEQGLLVKKEFDVETLSGIVRPQLSVEGGEVIQVTIDMGQPLLERSEIPMTGSPGQVKGELLSVGGVDYAVTSMCMGVPHTMVFVPDVEQVDLAGLGQAIETHPLFPRKTNVNFVQVLTPERIRVRTWERGAGATLACGTGSCASVVAGFLNGYTKRQVTVELYLGQLQIDYREDGRVLMTGPAATVFIGEYSCP